MRRPVTAIAGSIVAATLALAGCAGGDISAPTDTEPTNLSVGASLPPPTLDPLATDAASIPQVELYNVYETMVKINDDGELAPLLASSWELSDDETTYTFELRPNLTFASGRALTAADVVASLKRVQAKGTPVQQKQLSVVASAEAADDNTVVVTLKRRSNAWLYDMASQAGMVFDTEADVDYAVATAGSGPYQVSEYNEGDSVVLVPNEHYWGNEPRFDEVRFRYFSDPDALNNAMASGDLDIISNVQAPAGMPAFSNAEEFTVVEGTSNGEVTLGFNHSSELLANLDVRRAINHAIHREAILGTVWNGYGQLIGSMAVPTDPWYEDLSDVYPYDPELARKLLAESGAANPTIRLRLPNTAYATGAGRVIASQLEEIGFTVKTDQLEFAAWLDSVFTQADYDLTIVAHVEPRDIVKFANPDYYWRYDNPEFQELIVEADAAPAAEYPAIMKEAAALLSADAAANWLFMLPHLVVTKATITGVPRNAASLSFDLTGITER